MEHESFFTLLCDINHWLFELTLVFIFDVVLGMLVWPCLKRALKHHKKDDSKIAVLQKQLKEVRDIMGLKNG